MRRTWVAVLAIVLGVSPAGYCRELPSHLPAAPAAVMPPAAGAPMPLPADGAALPAPAAHPAAPGCGGCNDCRPHVSCWQRLCEWACYRPLPCYCSACDDAGHVHCFGHHGCNGCGGCGGGCCYNCFPPLYMWFLRPCHEGGPHALPAKGCASCGNKGCASCADGHHPEPALAAPAAGPLPAAPAAPALH
jgi:hypothetical protein